MSNPTPIPVELVSVDDALKESIQPQQPGAIPPTTTAEEQRITAGQRGINRLWEMTQAVVAIIVTATISTICVMLVVSGDSTLIMLGVSVISTSWTLIIAFYFQRTNHSQVGGVRSGQQGR